MAAVRALPVGTLSLRRCPARLSGCLGYASSTMVTSVELVTMVELTGRLSMGTSTQTAGQGGCDGKDVPTLGCLMPRAGEVWWWRDQH
jgi:hypothetical protein